MAHGLWAEIRSVKKDRKALRQFGLLVGSVLVLIATWIWWRNAGLPTGPALVLGATGGLLIGLGLVWPRVLRPLYHGWMALALVLGFIMTRVLLTVVFYGIITPTNLGLRLFRYDPMHRHPDPKAASYWLSREEPTDDPAKQLERYW